MQGKKSNLTQNITVVLYEQGTKMNKNPLLLEQIM